MKDRIFIKQATRGMTCYEHFGIHPVTAVMYGRKVEDIVDVKLKISDNQTIPIDDKSMTPDYWGWFEFKKDDFTLIYAKWFLLDMCFPAGISGSEKTNEGKAYRLEVIL